MNYHNFQAAATIFAHIYMAVYNFYTELILFCKPSTAFEFHLYYSDSDNDTSYASNDNTVKTHTFQFVSLSHNFSLQYCIKYFLMLCKMLYLLISYCKTNIDVSSDMLLYYIKSCGKRNAL